MPRNILRNPSLYSFVSFSIVLTPFINKPESSRDLIIFDIFHFLIWYYECFCLPLSKNFLGILASAGDAVAVNPNGIKKSLANSWSTFSINGKPVFSNQPRSLPRYPPDCIFLDSWVFGSFILADQLFAKLGKDFQFVH